MGHRPVFVSPRKALRFLGTPGLVGAALALAFALSVSLLSGGARYHSPSTLCPACPPLAPLPECPATPRDDSACEAEARELRASFQAGEKQLQECWESAQVLVRTCLEGQRSGGTAMEGAAPDLMVGGQYFGDGQPCVGDIDACWERATQIAGSELDTLATIQTCAQPEVPT